MPRNRKNSRRLIIVVAVMAAVALAGLSLIKVGEAAADGAAHPTGVTTDAKATPAVSEGETVATGSEPGVYAAVAKMLAALVVVILLAYGALYALRRMMGKRYGGGTGSGSLEILQTTHVGPHKTISLVRIGQRSVLVGVTDHQISTLTELDSQETRELIEAAVISESGEGFATLLSSAANKLKTVGLRKRPAVMET